MDDPLSPALRRAVQATLEAHKLNDYKPFQRFDFDDSYHSDADDRDNGFVRRTPLPTINPLRAHPITPPVSQHRHSRGLNSYRANNRKIPLHLRQQPSLETIASVTTTTSRCHYDSPEESHPLSFPQHDYMQEHVSHPLNQTTPNDPYTTAVSSGALSSSSSSGSSNISSTLSRLTLGTTVSDHHPNQSLFHRMMPHRADEQPTSPTRLVIKRNVSIDHMSTPSTPSTAFSPSQRHDSATGRSQSSSEWSASGYDTSSLTEREIKKFRKKGINPALYAEMRAAIKGKWTSPIAGNTFL